MRTRDLKPDFWTDEKVVQVSDAAKLLFQGLWALADREGRLEDKPVSIGFKIRPWDPGAVPGLLVELANIGLIVRYEVDGVKCIDVPNLPVHQRMHPREMASKLPPRPDGGGAGRGKARQGAPRHAIAPGSSGPSGSAKPSGPSGSAGPSGSSPPPPPRAPKLVVVAKKPLAPEQLTPSQRETWEFIQRGRTYFGHPAETGVPPDFPDWSDRLDAERVTPAQVDHALALYLRDEHFRDRLWPTAVFITDGVFRSRLPARRESS